MPLTPDQRQFLLDNFDRARTTFNEERKTILNSLLIIVTGTFVLSVSFISAFTDTTFSTGWALIASWVCMAISIVLFIASSHFKALADGDVMDEINKIFLDGTVPVPFLTGTTGKAPRFYKLSEYLLWGTYVFGFIGIVLLLVFAVGNFRAKQISKDTRFEYKKSEMRPTETGAGTESGSASGTSKEYPKLPNTGFEPH